MLLVRPASTSALQTYGSPNTIQVENALPGSVLGVAPLSTATPRAIEGYASETSALPGDTLRFHVSTSTAAPYRIEVYRLGWYGGAGARLVGCTPDCSGWRQGQPLPVPAPDANGLVQAGWPVTDTFTLPADATSGYYRVRFVLPNGDGAATFVVVRAATTARPAAILVQVPANTWEAYNSWGGRSLYDLADAAAKANRVSFDRPYAWHNTGNQNPFGWEYPFVLFAERAGYDISYQTDADTDADPSSLLEHRLVIDLGHDEYWTSGMRDAFEAARDAGVNLAFMGANDAYWQVRYEANRQIIVGYKSALTDPVTNPRAKTILFRALTPPRFECQLIGIQHQGGELNWPTGDFSTVFSSLANPWFAGTGFDGSSVLKGISGIETDTIPANQSVNDSCGNKLTVFFHHEGGGDTRGNADVTAYTAPSGAIVFAAGSKRLVWGLADPPAVARRGHGLVDPRLQRFIGNVLNDLSASRIANLSVALTETRVKTGLVKVLATVTNSGPDDVRAAKLDVALSPGATFVRVASSVARCTRVPLSCTLGPFAAGSTVEAVFTLRVRKSSRQAMRATASAPTALDPTPLSATTEVVLPSNAGSADAP